MPRSKKQPEYDPNELADLIETPAVGRGVGSHLIDSKAQSEEETTVVTSLDGTVATSTLTTEDTSQKATIVPGRKSFPAPPEAPHSFQTTTVDSEIPPPVVTCPEELSELTSIDDTEAAIVVDKQVATVGTSKSALVTSPSEVLGRFWMSDSGEIVPESRVRRVSRPADALSSGEETLYHLLLDSPALHETSATRSVQAGYEFLTRKTGFSRKTIQRTIDRLTAKHFIEIETPADIYRRTSTVYRVFGPAAVLERLAQRDCLHVARIGPGVAFVTPLAVLSPETVVSSNLTTAATERLSTVDSS